MTNQSVNLDRIANGGFGELTTLLCPRCGGDYLHHAGVSVYSRKEDAADTSMISIDGTVITGAMMPSAFVRNPSDRRDGIAIRFWCEICSPEKDQQSGDLEFTIAQNKGQTYLSWRF